MSVAIIGGNERMKQTYLNICKDYQHEAKIYRDYGKDIQNIGSPDLVILFINAMSHKMLKQVSNSVKKSNSRVIRCHTSSASALKKALDAIEMEA